MMRMMYRTPTIEDWQLGMAMAMARQTPTLELVNTAWSYAEEAADVACDGTGDWGQACDVVM